MGIFGPMLAQTDLELMATARLVGALYANMRNFQVFAGLTMLYFAAASFSEAARRLGKPQWRSRFYFAIIRSLVLSVRS